MNWQRRKQRKSSYTVNKSLSQIKQEERTNTREIKTCVEARVHSRQIRDPIFALVTKRKTKEKKRKTDKF